MADNVPTICFKGMVLAFITAVVIFVSFCGLMRIERYRATKEMHKLGALRYTPDGQPNPWFFFVRDIPTIQNLASLPFLNMPQIERTEKGFKVRGRDYEAIYERISRSNTEKNTGNTAESEPTGDNPPPTKEQPETDYGLTIVKGKTHFWKNPAGKLITLQKFGIAPNGEKMERDVSSPDNAIPVDDGTTKN